jgi:hypothetical protein
MVTRDGDSANFNLTLNISPQSLDGLLVREKISSEQVLILKIKKPDYLGQSKWELQFDDRIREAKILDDVWLRKFQSRDEDVRPGDAIKGLVRVEVSYGFGGRRDCNSL